MKSYQEFVQALGVRESSGDYKSKNSLGFLGRYQFGLARLCDLGLCVRRRGTQGSANLDFTWAPPHSESAFLGDPALQDQCFGVHVGKYRRWVLLRYQATLGHKFCGAVVDLSAAIAVCHLVGPGGLMYLMQGHDTHDANGTKASEYAAKFGGYEIPEGLPVELAPAAPASDDEPVA